MVVLGLITARGGSKGIPRKNLAPVCGRPLLAYTCAAALASRRLSRVVLSTDDVEIATAGRELGVEAPFLRPPELATDAARSIDVALHAVDWLEREQSWLPDAVMILQPTSPLRTAHHVDEALDRLAASGADTVVSVIEVRHQFSPYSLMRLADGCLRDFWDGPLPFDRFRRQEAPVLYARNGPAILATRVGVLRGQRSFYGGHVIPYVMVEEESLDIDTPSDLLLAEWYLTRKGGRPCAE